MLTLFETKKVEAENIYFRNLIALAKADGDLSNEEFDLLIKIGAAQGFEQDEIESMLEENLAEFELQIPTNDTERFDHIFDLVQMMLADGKVEDAEMDFCIAIAEKSGFSKAFAGVVVNKIAMNLSNSMQKSAIKAELESFLTF